MEIILDRDPTGSVRIGHEDLAPEALDPGAALGPRDAGLDHGRRAIGGGNQRHQPLDELAALHQDVGGAVAPAGLETQRESSIRAGLESLAGERGTGNVAAEPLEASPVAPGNGDFGVQAHAAMLGDAIGGFGIGSRFTHVVWLDAIPHASPWLAAVGAGRNVRAQGCCGE
ncbi:MAG: hypothetical protein MJE66_10145 [Proteobacteria bacterium]|nr:hypothetical protein [Pseudomonadota bacterium]